MTTSDVYTEDRTVKVLLEDALRSLNVIEPDESANTEQITICIRALNDLIYQFKGPEGPITQSMKVWQRERDSLTLTAKNNFNLKPSGGDLDIQTPVEIMFATLKNTDSQEVTLDPMSYLDYQAIGDKTAEGPPSRYYYEKRLDTGVLYLNFVPSDTSDTIELLHRQPLEIVTLKTQTLDVEDYLLRAIKWNLAVEVGPIFVESIPQIVTNLASESLAIAQTFEPENSDEYFQPGRD